MAVREAQLERAGAAEFYAYITDEMIAQARFIKASPELNAYRVGYMKALTDLQNAAIAYFEPREEHD